MKTRKVMLIIIFVLLVLCTLISVSYAFYIVLPNKTQNVTTNTTLPSCASITLSGTSTVSLTGDHAAPVSDLKVLSSTNYEYTFIVKNNCASQAAIVVALVPTNSSTLQIQAVKYAIKESSGSYPNAGSFLNLNPVNLNTNAKSDIKIQTGTEYTKGYQVLSTTLAANVTKTYKISVWVDVDEGGLSDNATMNKNFISYVVISDELN